MHPTRGCVTGYGNTYGPAKGLAAVTGNGVTQYDAQQFLLERCPDAWLMGGQ